MSDEIKFEPLSDEAWHSAYDKYFTQSVSTYSIDESSGFSHPFSNNNKYRGYYHCSRIASCSGTNTMWCPKWSRFGGRSGRHQGIDISSFDKSTQSTMPLRAVADGVIEYYTSDPSWGDAIKHYTKINGSLFLIIYAHLAKRSRFSGTRNIKHGSIIATPGCTGNAGDGRGKCLRHLNCPGRIPVADHVHIEAIEFGSSFKNPGKHRDPASIFNWRLKYANDNSQKLIKCRAIGAKFTDLYSDEFE